MELMTQMSPGVRRLCVCVRAARPGLLDRACQEGGIRWLYLEHIPAQRLELGFAAPGVDEAELVTTLVASLRAVASGAARPAGTAVLAAFHVGITRVQDDGMGGVAVTRVRELLAELSRAPDSSQPGTVLAVGVSDTLFRDIGAECGFAAGWAALAPAQAWYRVYGGPGDGRERPA